MPPNLSLNLVAMRLASCSRPAARMFAVNPPVCCTAGRVFDFLSMQTSARGGSVFLGGGAALWGGPPPTESERCRFFFVPPLKALPHAAARTLRSPLVGIRRQMESRGLVPPATSVATRTGDTPADVRRSME